MNNPFGKLRARSFRQKQGNSGFTLLEIIIAVFFVSVALIGIIEIFNIDISAIENTREQMKANSKAQEIMEEIAIDPGSRVSRGDELLVEDTGLSQLVTVNVSWQTLKSKGAVVLNREFFKW
ncbi:hypothetical protein ACFL5G_02220 [Candidatus Margulisiibacteriota bacterium]